MDKNLKGKKVLVTGYNGYIGRHLVTRLITEGAIVYGVGRNVSNEKGLIKEVNCDISDEKQVKAMLEMICPNIIFHLAAYGLTSKDTDIYQCLSTNINGTVNLIQHSKSNNELELFINTGSEFEYGDKSEVIKENMLLQPMTEYSVTKASATLIAHQLANRNNLPIITLRLFSIYGGEENRERFIPYIIDSILNKNEVNLTECEQLRDYVYIDDIIDSYICAYKYFNKKSEIVNISTNNAITLKEIVNIIKMQINEECNINIGALPYRENEMWKLVGDNSKAKELINWTPKTNINVGIGKTIEYYRRCLIDEKRK